MLDAQVPFVERMPGGGNVTRGVDPGCCGAQVLVGDDPVVHQEAGLCGQCRLGQDADAGDDEVGGLHGSVGDHDPLDGS